MSLSIQLILTFLCRYTKVILLNLQFIRTRKYMEQIAETVFKNVTVYKSFKTTYTFVQFHPRKNVIFLNISSFVISSAFSFFHSHLCTALPPPPPRFGISKLSLRPALDSFDINLKAVEKACLILSAKDYSCLRRTLIHLSGYIALVRTTAADHNSFSDAMLFTQEPSATMRSIDKNADPERPCIIASGVIIVLILLIADVRMCFFSVHYDTF